MDRRALALVAALAAPALAGCFSPQEAFPMRSSLLAERGAAEGGEPIRWYLAEGGFLVESKPLEPAAPSLGIEMEEVVSGEHTFVVVKGLREDGWGGGAILPGEVLLGVDGKHVSAIAEVEEAIAASAPGNEIEVVLESPRGVRFARAILGRRADLTRTKLSAFLEKKRTGLSFCTIEGEAAAAIFGSPEPRVLLSRVLLGTPAWKAGLRRGDRVKFVEGREPASAQEAVKFLSGPPGAAAVIGIDEGGETRRFEFLREEDVEASHGFAIPILFGSTGDRRYQGSYVLGGILWSRVSIWWNVQEREQASASETGTLLWLIRVRSSPESATLYLFGIPIRLR